METYSALSEFKTSVESKKAHLYISFPCLAESAYNKGLSSINFVENKLTEMQFNILGKPSRYVVNDSLIFNTQYHLTKEGVDLRTILLIEDFKKLQTQKKDRISL